MMKKISLLTLFLCINYILTAQNSSITIYPDSNVHTISPYIYGVDGSLNDKAVKSIRLGGNRWTGYNWETGLSNAGIDLNNISDGYLLNNIQVDSSHQPGAATTYFFDKARDYSQFFLATIPMAGYVANQNGTATKAPSPFWNTIVPFKNAPFTLTPDLTDNFVYTDEYINFLITKLGSAANGGINAYGLDNEPDLWHSTHPYLHPAGVTISELISKTTTTALAIKSIDSTALVFGPSMSGWYGCQDFGSNDYNLWYLNSSKYKSWFLNMYLDSMRIHSNKAGKRLIDVVNFHWYPEASGTDDIRIVNTSGGAEPLTQAAIKARLQAPRSLWDSTYIENSGIAQNNPVEIIKRVKSSVNNYYPGTKIGITEYRYGTENHYSGGLALVDALGVFGQEGIFFATKWYATGSTAFLPYSQSAFNLYTNYDGNYDMFGDKSVKTQNSSNDTLSTFASFDSKNKLHIITINKVAKSTTIVLNLTKGYYTNAYVVGFDSTNATITQRDSIKSTQAFNKCTYILPPYSALHFVFTPVQLPQITKALTDSSNTKIVKVFFSLPLNNTVINNSDIKIVGINGPMSCSSATITDSVITINLNNAIADNDTSLYISIANVLTYSNANLKLNAIDSIKIYNILKTAIPQFLSATLLQNGNQIIFSFSKDIASISTLGLNCINNKIDTLKYKSYSINSNTITFNLQNRLDNTSNVTGIYNDLTGILFKDNSIINNLNIFPITNQITTSNLIIDTAFIVYPGFKIQLQCNKRINDNSVIKDFKVYINNVETAYSASISTSRIYLQFDNKINDTDKISLEYIDSGRIFSFDNGYLHSFTTILNNTLPKPAERVTIPGIINGDSTYYQMGNTAFNVNSSSKSGTTISIYPDGIATYRIYVPKDSIYTLIINRHCQNNTTLLFTIANESDTFKFPSTNNFFREYGTTINLKKGNYTFTTRPLLPLGNSIELDYFSFVYGEHLPKANFLYGQVSLTGRSVSLFVDEDIITNPVPQDFQLMVNNSLSAINTITYSENNILLQLNDTIFSKQTVTVSLTNPLIETLNNSSVFPFTNAVVTNQSRVVKTFDAIIPNYFVSVEGNKITHNLPQSSTISLYNLLGIKIVDYSGENKIISLDNFTSGCYIIVATNQHEAIYQSKIIITK